MGSLVQYRDLPGGPTKLQFCDEPSEYCLCTNCGMLSMSMLEDKNHHVFCETCLVETSEKHHREHIYCKYENKQVSIFEMFEAPECVKVIREQYVLCPKPKCGTLVTLGQLEAHHMYCQPTVTCPTCDRQVKSAEWSSHSKDCRERGTCKTPSKLLPQKPTNEDSDTIALCPHCARKVRGRNLAHHVTRCVKAPQPCIYCEKEFSREDIKVHLAVCEKNPDNVPVQIPEKRKEFLRPVWRFEYI